MKINNVIVVFLKSDNKEHLVYKTDDDVFYDLNTKEKYNSNDIDFDTQLYLKDALYDFKYTNKENMSKRAIKKIYNKDRNQLIESSSLVIADVKKVTDYEIIYSKDMIRQYQWKAVFLYKVLLKKYSPKTYEDLRTQKIYFGEIANIFSEGTIYVEDGKNNKMKSIKEYYPNLGSLEKKKVLELAYKISKE